MKTRRLAILGLGQMGGILARRWMEAKTIAPKDICFTGRDEKRMRPLLRAGVKKASSAREAARAADLVLLCVKPKDVLALADEIAPACRGKTVVSIAAGVRLRALSARLPGAKVARAMPNIACEMGEGVVGLCAAKTNANEMKHLTAIFQSMGLVVWLNESQMDALTAVSGSGPAYGFEFVEVMSRQAQAGGIPKAMARAVAAQTALGAARLMLAHPEMSKDELVARVASKGGTTEAALKKAEEAGVWKGLGAAIGQARKRSAQMGRQTRK